MNKQPLISIIIPAYNAEPFLEATLSSAFNQTYSNIEVIVINDGSTDKTAEIIKRYESRHQNCRSLSQVNRGQSAARKNGLLSSHGQWVSFLDADNILLPQACETLVANIQSGYDVYYGDIRYFETERPAHFLSFDLHYFPEVNLENLIAHNFINFLGTFIKKEKVIDCFDESFRRADDHIIWLKLILKGARFQYLNKILGHLRFHRENLSFQGSYLIETAETNIKIFDWLETEVKKKYVGIQLSDLLSQIKNQRSVWLTKGYIGALIVKDKKNAIDWLKRKRALTRNNLTYYANSVITFFLPLFIFSPALRYARRKFVMRKYSQASDALL
ncbi:MAG: glycosyltransferase [Candidatus Liptonbacteria bacterium]|nr:glycosyltransferase [Candidatus Liptonbacteria bacterium]